LPLRGVCCVPVAFNVKARMNWLLLSAALVFAWLAYDAWKIAVPAAEVPYSVTAKGLGQSVDGVPLQEQARRKDWNSRYGLGDLSQAVWLWTILALVCAVGAAAGFFA
jgi:hypothetical protein